MGLGTTVKKISQRGKKPSSHNSITLNAPVSVKTIKASLIRRGVHPAIVDAITKSKEKTYD